MIRHSCSISQPMAPRTWHTVSQSISQAVGRRVACQRSPMERTDTDFVGVELSVTATMPCCFGSSRYHSSRSWQRFAGECLSVAGCHRACQSCACRATNVRCCCLMFASTSLA